MTPSEPDLVVIDTNAVLDWLLFDDPRSRPMGAALAQGRLRWVASQAMLDELAAVLQRGAFQRWAARLPRAQAMTDSLCALVPTPPVPAGRQLICSDGDDQKFIDLAMTLPTRWLLSRDKALLRLARRARQRGVGVMTPAAWALETAHA